jgi:hypothetical protein
MPSRRRGTCLGGARVGAHAGGPRRGCTDACPRAALGARRPSRARRGSQGHRLERRVGGARPQAGASHRRAPRRDGDSTTQRQPLVVTLTGCLSRQQLMLVLCICVDKKWICILLCVASVKKKIFVIVLCIYRVLLFTTMAQK